MTADLGLRAVPSGPVPDAVPDAVPEQGELATGRIQAAIDAAAAAGGGRVVVPSGVHRTGALRLRSHVELHLEVGAVLQLVPDPALHPLVTARWEGRPTQVHQPCLWAQDETDVAITGLGTVDGGGAAWWDLVRHRPDELAHPRPTLVGLHGCTRVTIRDVTLRNSPSWTVHPALCRDVTIADVRIHNPADSPNTDGIDPESCRGVRISGCHIDVGDDCIAIKAGTEHDPAPVSCEDVVITGCTMVHGHGAVVLGSEMSGGIRNVVVTGCVFRDTDRGLRIKTRRGRGGVVEDVRLSDVVMDGVLCPVAINPFYDCGPEGALPHVGDRAARAVDAGTPRIRRVHLAHVTARGVHASAGHLSGLPEAPLSELTVHDLTVSFATDPVPGSPDMALGLDPVTAQGLRLAHVVDSELTGVRVRGAVGPAVLAEGCTDVVLDVRG